MSRNRGALRTDDTLKSVEPELDLGEEKTSGWETAESPASMMNNDPGGLDRSFYKEIGRRRLLTRDEEVHLGERARRQDMVARNHLVETNLRLVVSLARRLVGYGVPLCDLVQEGVLGLIRAAERYDPSSGCRFGTYAYFWIRQALLKGLARSKRTIRVPFLMDAMLSRARRFSAGEGNHGKVLLDLTHKLRLNADCVTNAYLADRSEVSIEGGPERGGRLKVLSGSRDPEDAAVESVSRQEVRDILDSLPPRDAFVLKSRFGVGTGRPLTLEEVGSRMGITKEAVRQIQNRALSQLRHPSRKARLTANP